MSNIVLIMPMLLTVAGTFLSVMLTRAEAILTITEPPKHAGKVFETLHYKYYGLSDVVYTGSTILLDDKFLCAKLGHPLVQDSSWFEPSFQNVIAMNPSPLCEPFSTYETLLKKGRVLALVVIGTGTLGAYPEYDFFEHSSWNMCEHCSSDMILLNVPDPDGTLAALAVLEGAKLQVQLSPHTTTSPRMHIIPYGGF